MRTERPPAPSPLGDTPKHLTDHRALPAPAGALALTAGVGCMGRAMPGLVSCLTVTKGRVDLLRRAVACFQRQSYPERELIVVNDDDDGTRELISGLGDERIVYVRPDGELPLGALRNVGLRHARGVYFAQWDDDDWYHPERLAAQVEALERGDADICLLERWTLAWPERSLYLRSKRRPWEGSIVARRLELPAYEALRHSEDSVFLEECRKRGRRIGLLDRPELYVYVVHGGNTFPEEHFADNVFRPHTGELSAAEVADVERKLGWRAVRHGA